MQLTFSGVSYTYPSTQEPVLKNVSVVFPEGWTGLLGDNGCGKSTLAKVAWGLLVPDAGTVTGGLLCALCPQEADEPPDGLLDFAVDYGGEARRLRRVFRLEDDMPWRFDGLSFDERKKLRVAVALWRRPDVLVADESANHLDLHSVQALERALSSFPGALLPVSHDRVFLEARTETVWEAGDGRVVVC